MSFKLTIGRAAILSKPAFTNEAICSLIPRDPKALLNRYLYHALSVLDFEREIDPAVKGKTLNKAKLNRLKLKLPPSFEEQARIADFFDLIDDELQFFEDKLTALQRQKKGLMQQLLTGQVRVVPPSNSPQRGEDWTSPPLGGIEGGRTDAIGEHRCPKHYPSAKN